MAFGSNVAPPKKAILPNRSPWTCSHGHGPNAYYWVNCPVCGESRPPREG